MKNIQIMVIFTFLTLGACKINAATPAHAGKSAFMQTGKKVLSIGIAATPWVIFGYNEIKYRQALPQLRQMQFKIKQHQAEQNRIKNELTNLQDDPDIAGTKVIQLIDPYTRDILNVPFVNNPKASPEKIDKLLRKTSRLTREMMAEADCQDFIKKADRHHKYAIVTRAQEWWKTSKKDKNEPKKS